MPPRMLQLPPRHSAATLRGDSTHGGVRSIVLALLADVIVAISKLAAGLVTGSTAMLAEAVHSTIDSINEVLLGIWLRGHTARPTQSIRSGMAAHASCGRSSPRSRPSSSAVAYR